MKRKIVKILFSILIIAIVIWNMEKIFLKQRQDTEILESDSNIQPDANNQHYNALVIGNSITLERDGIGMAASDQYHDYYYLTKERLGQKYKNINMKRISCIHWEENRIITSRTDWINENLKSELVSDLDLVIFQLGDNCVPTESFDASVTELVNHVKKYSPDAKMILVGMWFINQDRLNMMPQIAQKLGMEFVDISDLVVDENKSYIGAEVTTVEGNKNIISTIEEAFHPNNEGMKKIADRICEKIGI